MNKVLLVETSPRGNDSLSRKAGRLIIERLKARGAIHLTTRDLQSDSIPHVDAVKMLAYFTPADQLTPAQRDTLALSDQLTEEVLSVDTIVISTPMWNFSLPSVLKAWVDHIVRAGKTFKFGPNGLEGMLKGKKIYVATSSGSVFSSGPFQAYDHVGPYLKAVFGFMGATEVTIIRIEGTNSPDVAAEALKKAMTAIESI